MQSENLNNEEMKSKDLITEETKLTASSAFGNIHYVQTLK